MKDLRNLVGVGMIDLWKKESFVEFMVSRNDIVAVSVLAKYVNKNVRMDFSEDLMTVRCTFIDKL